MMTWRPYDFVHLFPSGCHSIFAFFSDKLCSKIKLHAGSKTLLVNNKVLWEFYGFYFHKKQNCMRI